MRSTNLRDQTISFQKEFIHVPERIFHLVDLAYNLWWSWHPEARMVFKLLDRPAWKASGHNPIKMLRSLPIESLNRAASSRLFLRHYDAVISAFYAEIEDENCWFSQNVSMDTCSSVIYFSAEYGLHHSLPLYAGGLGFLAGDYIKECSDLGLPLVAIGFMYPKGYMRQIIDDNGWQHTVDEELDRRAAPIMQVCLQQGKPLIIQVPMINPPLYIAVWKVMVGRVPLYLLDTDISLNEPSMRTISARLYSGDKNQRLLQEIVLGIGGMHLLHVLGISHSIIHLNEGHAAFALLERIRRFMEKGSSYPRALQDVMNTSVFTTHTPVPAGHDIFPYELMDTYFSSYYPLLGLSRDTFYRLGADSETEQGGFNMTALALRLSTYHNAVSRKHKETAYGMWKDRIPEIRNDPASFLYVTNGIHTRTWIDPKMLRLFNEYLGQNWLSRQDSRIIWELIEDIPDDLLWKNHMLLKLKLINRICERSRIAWFERNISPSLVLAEGSLLDPMVMTIGFSRRFATYKRADLIFSDKKRLLSLLCHPTRPVQIIFAGKAHPDDDPGKEILQRIILAAKDPAFQGRIAFVENYDEQLSQYLVHGVDLWLNNPVPPMEACGTSGMKAALNGVPQVSIPDGWWLEGYNTKNGWVFGEENGERDDMRDALALYDLLEEEIIPLYYATDDQGIPHEWIAVMKEAMKAVGCSFTMKRMVTEYVSTFYLKAHKYQVQKKEKEISSVSDTYPH